MAASMGNIRDSEIIGLLKSNWLKLDTNDHEEEKLKFTSLKDLFTTYDKLRRIPKLISKLLTAINETISENSGGNNFIQGHVDISILQLFSRCVCSLPIGQTLELWELFLEAYEKANISSKCDPMSGGGIFLIAQFFSTFLLHAQMFDDAVLPIIKEKVGVLIIKMHKLLRETSFILDKEQNDAGLFKLAFLLLVQAYNEVKLVFHVYGVRYFSTPGNESDACCVFQFFPSHNSTGCSHVEVCLPFFEDKDKRFGYIMYKLLVQEIKAKVVKQELCEEEKQLLKCIVAFLLEVTTSLSTCSAGAAWNLNMNSIKSSNYGTAYWNLFLGHVHLFAGFINNKSLVRLCSAMVEVLVNCTEKGSSLSLESSVLGFISSNFFEESKLFQTAFVTSLWKCCSTLMCSKKRSHDESEDKESSKSGAALIFQELHSSSHKWEKYAHTTPKGMADQEINSMWSLVKTASDMLNLLLENPSNLSGNLKIAEISRLLKVFNYLPLEYLMPNNQSRCVLGLSTTFFLLQNSSAMMSSSVYSALIDVFNLLVPIFEGVRSIWFFDFVYPVPYIKALITVIEKMQQSDFSGNFEICKKLLDKIFNLSMRNLQSVLNIEDYMPQLVSDMKNSRSSALAFLCLLQRLIQLLQRSYLQPQLKEACERLATSACSSIAKSMHHWKKDGKSDVDIFSSLLTCYEALIKLVLNPKCKFGEEKRKKWLKYLKNILELTFEKIRDLSMEEEEVAPFLDFICTVSIHRADLSPYVPNDFSIQVWKFVHHSISEKRKASKQSFFTPEIRETKHLSAELKCYFCRNSANTKKNPDYMQSVDQDGSNPPFDMCNFSDFVRKYYFTELERNTLTKVVKTSSEEEFEIIFQDLCNQMEEIELDIGVLDAVDFVIKLSILSCLFNDVVNETQVALLSKLTQKCLMKLHFITSQTCKNGNCLLKIVVPSLNFMSSVLKKGKTNLPKQCIVQCLYTCVAVKAESCIEQPTVFVAVYNAIWSLLHELMVTHTISAISSSPALIPSIIHLLKLIIYASNQYLMSTYNDETQQEILLCAQNLDKLLGLMTKHKKEFAKVVPYLVAEYVHVAQNITIYPSVKVVLIMAINKLLDICSEESLKMLAVNINHKCREIFNSLVKNYKQQCFIGQI